LAFCQAAPFVWGESRDYWYKDQSFPSWEIFKPLLEKFNKRRREVLEVVLLLLDEAMSGMRPKTSKTGDFPNLTYEPRKPVDLGVMLKHAAEALTGVLSFQDVVATPDL